MAKNEKNVIKLIMKLVGHKTGELSNVEYVPQKNKFREETTFETRLPRCKPEEVGIESSFILDLFRNLYENSSCHVHRVMVVRKGYVIGELTDAPFKKDAWHVTHSMCKSVTGMAIGFLVAEGKLSLDEKLEKIFSGKINPIQHIFSNSITVRHLLTMTSGVAFNESGAIAANDWRKQFLEAQQKNAPGAVFEYNSMNSYMLSAIITEITGESLVDYLKPRLFEPLGIERFMWETCPQNVTKGGWGMFLRIEDMAKLGLLYLQKGKYNGKQILPEEWVDDATSSHVETGKESSPGYGYQLWTNGERQGAYTFNGMLGQNVYIYPDADMLIVTQAGNDDLFQAGKMSTIVRDKMRQLEFRSTPIEEGPDVRKNQIKLKEYVTYAAGNAFHQDMVSRGGWNQRSSSMSVGKTRNIRRNLILSKRTGFQDAKASRHFLMKKLNGVTYDMDDQGVGLLPIFMQVTHNNYTDGIKSIGFSYDEKKDAFYLLIQEGETLHRIICSTRENPVYNDIDEHGESYMLCVISEFTTDEYHRPVLHNKMYFVEDSTSRIMNIYFGKREPLQLPYQGNAGYLNAPDFIGVRFDEIPGSSMLLGIMDQFGSIDQVKGLNGILVNWLNEYGAMDALNQAIRSTVRPKLHGTIHKDVGNSSVLEYDGSSDDSEDKLLLEEDE